MTAKTSRPEPKERPAPPPRTRGQLAARISGLVRYVLIFVTAVLIVDAFFGEKGLLALLKARKEFAAVSRALDTARQENTALRDEARRLREDPTAIEELARRDLGLIKPGEKLFIVKDVTNK